MPKQKPESMVAESLRMKGELEFTRLLRVDGRFEGELITDKGSLVVGPKGEVIGDLKNMQVHTYTSDERTLRLYTRPFTDISILNFFCLRCLY